MIETVFTGVGLPEAALTINRVALGVFFTFSGYHKLFNKKRHRAVTHTLAADRVPDVAVMQWAVPSIEFSGGLSLTVGLLSPLAALGLIGICFVATCVDGLKRIPTWHPLDKCDYVDDVLYLPEVLYIGMLLIVVLAGPGPVSLDNWIVSWLM